MTDVPRRSFPLVVAPPGGFEEAVRRGRRRRRKQTGGSSAAVLVLVAALAYSMVGHPGGGTDTLDPANNPRNERAEQGTGPGSVTQTLAPSPTATAVAVGTSTRPVASGPRVTRSAPKPTAGVGQPATRPSPAPRHQGGQPQRTYAPRPPITRDQEQYATETDCLTAQTQEWCTALSVTPSSGAQRTYATSFTICRSFGADAGKLHFSRKQMVDFAAVDTANNDTVWTYSAGQPVVKQSTEITIDAGYCMTWHMTWDGYDDFGYTPAAGQYTMSSRSITAETLPAATATFDHA